MSDDWAIHQAVFDARLCDDLSIQEENKSKLDSWMCLSSLIRLDSDPKSNTVVRFGWSERPSSSSS